MNLTTLPYEDFNAYVAGWLVALPTTPYAQALERATGHNGYLTGYRGWDTWQVFKWAEFKPADAVLDCGSWQTFIAVFIAQFVTWVDASDNFYWEQRSFVKEQNLPSSEEWMRTIHALDNGPQKHLTVTDLDLQAIRYPDCYFDKITCISTIEHVLDDHKAMSEMLRVLRPGGRLLLTTEFDEMRGKNYSENDGSWYRVYNRETWDALLAPYSVIHQEISDQPHQHYFTVAFAAIEKPL